MSDEIAKTGNTTAKLKRRDFLTGAGVAVAGTALAAPSVVTAQSPITLKMQTSWPASDVWQTMAQQYADRVGKMADDADLSRFVL